MNKIKLWFRYRYLRYKIKKINAIKNKRFSELTERQQRGIIAFKAALYNRKAKLFVNRTKNFSYIYIPSEKLFIRLGRGSMVIANGQYFDISLQDYEYDYLVKLYDKKLDRIRQQWDDSILSKTTNNLDKLIKKLQK